MKQYTLSLLFLISVQAHRLPDEMTVHKLAWSEFLETPPKGGSFAASTGYRWNMTITTDEDGKISAEVKCSFLPYSSYTTTYDPYVLSHEQLHLTIADSYCRQLEQAFKAVSGCKDCEETLNSMYKTAWDKMDAEQKIYDAETNHSIDKAAQGRWEQKVKSKLP